MAKSADFVMPDGSEPPLSFQQVNYVFFTYSYSKALLILVMLFGVGLCFFIYGSDEKIRGVLKGQDINIQKYQKFLLKLKRTKTLEERKPAYKKKWLLWYSVIAVITGFLLVMKTSFYISFFLPLSYFFYLKLNPHSKQELWLETIMYPWIIGSILVLLTAYFKTENVNHENLTYLLIGEITKAVLPFVICVLVSFYYLNRRFKYQELVNVKPAYLVIVTIFVVLGIVRYATVVYLENIDLSSYY
ncbi:hypothetical protein [Zunongwangia sp. H14]|uniref:hypothetical protein n=1 Tax=Zunongwangia sp. H14 TaxID=3240792 RepID=UPI00356157C9